jgi:hypothetical protein
MHIRVAYLDRLPPIYFKLREDNKLIRVLANLHRFWLICACLVSNWSSFKCLNRFSITLPPYSLILDEKLINFFHNGCLHIPVNGETVDNIYRHVWEFLIANSHVLDSIGSFEPTKRSNNFTLTVLLIMYQNFF